MRKKNLLMAVVSFAALSLTFNVNAANKTVDANLCKDKKVYTNYYYFLSADVYDSENADRYGVYPRDPITTQGQFKNNIILIDSAKQTGIFGANGITKEYGVIPITYQASDGVNGKNIADFYTEFLKYTNHTDGAWTETDGVTSRMVTHSWAKLNASSQYEPQDYQVVISNKSVLDLVNASIRIPLSVDQPTTDSTNSEKNIYFNVTRRYNADATAVKPYVADTDYATIVAPGSNGQDMNWYLSPALYYIQYCETATNTPVDSNSFVIRYDANGGTNAPATSAQTNVGTCAYVTSDKPKRTNYTFLGWSTDKNATKADSKYDAGECYKGTDGDLTLYAVWKKSTVVNPGTGIASHIAAYVVIIALGASALVFARKKGLFRQI